MKLIEALLDALPADPIPVRKVIIGVHWTLVCSRCCGLGSTMHSARSDFSTGKWSAARNDFKGKLGQ
jgi:hypothetical protein